MYLHLKHKQGLTNENVSNCLVCQPGPSAEHFRREEVISILQGIASQAEYQWGSLGRAELEQVIYSHVTGL